MSGIGSAVLVLLDVQLQSGQYETNIKVKGENYGDYFIYDNDAKTWAVMNNKIILGQHTSLDNTTTFGIGDFAGYLTQHPSAIAIGSYAGNAGQKINAIAIGTEAGIMSQMGIAIGAFSGRTNQQSGAIAIGKNAGYQTQGETSIAIGNNTGKNGQLNGAIAIGSNAGLINQKLNAVAIGNGAGITNQFEYSIAIGNNVNALTTNTIVIDASSSPLIPATSGLFIRPIRGPNMATNLLSWDTSTKEIFYNGSSERFKYDIEPLTNGKSIYELKPREFKYKEDNCPDVGLIAEEAFYTNNAFAYLDKDGIPEGIQWNAITTSLIQEMQEMKRRITALRRTTRSASSSTGVCV